MTNFFEIAVYTNIRIIFVSKTYINKVLISETQRFLITVRKVLKDGFEPNVFNITSGKYIQLFQKWLS